MTITHQLFEAFIQCPTKCFLRARVEPPTGNVYSEWVHAQCELYRRRAVRRLPGRLAAIGQSSGPSELLNVASADWRFAIDVPGHAQGVESRIHAVERVKPSGRLPSQLVPIRFARTNRPNYFDKLMLAFDALVLSESTGRNTAFGRIIYGEAFSSARVKTPLLEGKVRAVVERIGKLIETGNEPELVLNRHCAECEFQTRCRRKAMEIDELSLLASMKPKEREKHRSKGIFTVNQLSYTFRPRRQPRRQNPLPKAHSSALQALAIRENTVYIDGTPQLPQAETSVYLDIEGLSTSGPYYLVGALIVSQTGEQFHSFWADQRSDETTAFTEFVATVSRLPDYRVFHYGTYDTTALKLVGVVPWGETNS